MLVELRVNTALRLAGIHLALGMVAALLVQNGIISLGRSLVLLAADRESIVLLVPLLERGGINLNNGVLHQRLGTHKLVVGCVVNNINNARLLRGALGTPRKVAVVQAQSAKLFVAAAKWINFRGI